MNPDQIEIIRNSVSRRYLEHCAEALFGNMIKAVVDVERRIMAIGGELHADEEQILLDDGSQQSNLWGINLYTDLEHPEWIEYDSMTNLRPSQDNRTRGVDDPAVRAEIASIIAGLVTS